MKQAIWIVSLLLLIVIAGEPVIAQTDVDITSVSPNSVTRSALPGTITINGNNYTVDTTVELVGVGALAITAQTANQLQVTLPNSVAGGTYDITVSDPVNNSATFPSAVTVPPALTATNSEPAQMTQGATSNVSIFGTNFTVDTTVRLQGLGLLTVTFVNSTSLLAAIPNSLVAGTYSLIINDPTRGEATLTDTLTINAPVLPTNTPRPTATQRPPATPVPIPTAIPTLPPSTPIPGQPNLIVSSFSATPNIVPQGGIVTFSITVINQGNRTAESFNAGLGAGGSLIPVGAQTTMILPNVFPGNSYTFTLNALAQSDAPSGTNSVPLNLAYRDFQNNQYNTQSTLSVEVDPVVMMSQISLNSYSVLPDPLRPGEEVDVVVFLTNTGTDTASQVQLTVPIGSGILLAGPQGNSFTMGNISPGAQVSRTLSLIVDSAATAGVQSQGFDLSYVQDGQMQTGAVFMTLTVDPPSSSSILLQSYDIGQDSVQPGERFMLNATLMNVGSADVNETLVSFQLPESTSTTGTTNTATFAPLGGGGTVLVGDILADGQALFEQEFIVNGSVESGIYTLPITVRYLKADGTRAEEILNASIVVLVPPRLRFIEQLPIPSRASIGDVVDVSLTVQNIGVRDVNLLSAQIIGEGYDNFGEDEILLQTLRPNDEAFIEATLSPFMEGEQSFLIEFTYLNDLNQTATYVQVYTLTISPEPTPRPTRPPVTPVVAPDFENQASASTMIPDDFWERLLLGFLGLGS